MSYHIAFRSVHGDLTSSRGFRWPYPGKMAVAPGPVVTKNKDACPSRKGDGLCIAKTFSGAASGSIPAITCLVVRYSDKDVLGEDEHKVRVSKCKVVEIIDLPLLARSGLLSVDTLVNLRSANLSWANLRSADLSSADLRSANLRSADLSSANLRWADLRSANLSSADLRSADLRSANLSWADLSSADLRWANLRSADLSWADLSWADLNWARNYELPGRWRLTSTGVVEPA